MAELDLGRHEIRAAMRVLGVLPREVAPLDPAAFEGNKVKYEHMEAKRQNLMEEVRRKAKEGDVSPEKLGALGGASREERNAEFMRKVEEAEANSMKLMAKIAKKDVQKVIIEELEQKVTSHRNKKRQEESKQRNKALLKQRDEELALRQKEAAKKADRVADVRTRALNAIKEHGEALEEQLAKANGRAEKSIQDRKDKEAADRARNFAKRDAIFERVAKREADLLQGRQNDYASHCVKMAHGHQRRQDILDARESNVEEIAEKQRKIRENVQNHLEKKQADAEKKYWEISQRHQDAAAKRKETLAADIKFYQTTNSKRQQSHQKRYESMLKEWEEQQIKHQNERMSPTSAKSKGGESGDAAALLKNFSDSVLLAAERRRNHVDVVAANRERLRRAHHYAVEQQVDKLRCMRQKVQVMEDAKATADKRRTEVTAKCAREKMHMQDKVDRSKNSKDPEKMYDMLEELEPDKEAIDRINELLGELGMPKIGPSAKEDEETK